MAEQFKWASFYMELATELLKFKNDRGTLIEKLKNVYSAIDMKLPKLESDDIPEDIDPFTVFGLFNKGITGANRVSIMKGLSTEFEIDMDISDDFAGIPILNNMMATFYAFSDNPQRKDDDIDNLWAVFETAINLAEEDTQDNRSMFKTAFDKARSQYAVRWNLTMGLFWIRPYYYVNLDARNRKYLSSTDNTSASIVSEMKSMTSVPTAEKYLSFRDMCMEVINSGKYGYSSFPELSHMAYIADTDKAWLVTYNKDKWFWDGFTEKCEGTKTGQTYVESWACASKKPQIGDEVFLIKLGEQPRGIIGHGMVARGIYEKDHFDTVKAAKGKKEKAIDVSFDWLINYDKETIISQDELEAKCPAQHWSPQSSGIEIKPEALSVLRELWKETIHTEATDDWWPSLDEYDPDITAQEYHDCFINETIVKHTWLKALHEMYQMPDHLGTCKQLGEQYGFAPSHYISYLTSAAQKVANHTRCMLLPREEENSRFWPVLFQGRHPSDKNQGSYCWRMRQPVVEAMEMLIDEGVFAEKERESMAQFEHNMILYGPPGTGKTYNSVSYAVAICDERPLSDVMKEPYSEVLIRYRELQNAGRIAFTTFHQSYGYEEFIEGIKPKLNDESETLGYSIEDGVFKEFCRRAKPINIQTSGRTKVKDHPRIWVMLLGGPGMTQLKEECFNKNEVRLGWNNYENVEWEDDESLSWRSKQMLYAFTYEMELGDIVFIEKDSHSIDAIGVIAGDYEYDKSLGEYPRRRAVDWIVTNIDEDMVQYLPGGRKQLARFSVYSADYISTDALSEILNKHFENKIVYEDQEDKPYVFIVDEINRGNISKIFGELITLIEDTKRAGASEAMEAILPYSGEPFSVPKNVYILGTMNTADRSIALMDTALRRRFKFTEMMPDPEVLESLGVGTIVVGEEELNVARMLDVINERIEFLYDREHTIGHAFFTKLAEDPTLETLAGIFEKNVIPLLQEYFYEDYEKIQLVLGDNFKDDEYKFVLDRPLKIRDIFNGNPDIDLPEKGYVIQREAFFKLDSYKQIGKDL